MRFVRCFASHNQSREASVDSHCMATACQDHSGGIEAGGERACETDCLYAKIEIVRRVGEERRSWVSMQHIDNQTIKETMRSQN